MSLHFFPLPEPGLLGMAALFRIPGYLSPFPLALFLALLILPCLHLSARTPWQYPLKQVSYKSMAARGLCAVSTLDILPIVQAEYIFLPQGNTMECSLVSNFNIR